MTVKIILEAGVNHNGSLKRAKKMIDLASRAGADFIDMTGVYQQTENGVTSHSCGKTLDFQFDYPSHFMSHIVIIARALKFQFINAYLINHQN